MLGLFRDKTAASASNVLINLYFLPLPLWLFWWNHNLWGWRKKEKSSGIHACHSVKVLDSCLRFGAAKKNEHAMLTIYRCSSTCWHLKTPALAQIHHRTNKNQRQIAFSISWTGQEPRGLVGSSVISDPAVPALNSTMVNSLFLCHFFFSKWGQRKISKSFTCTAMASAHARQRSL